MSIEKSVYYQIRPWSSLYDTEKERYSSLLDLLSLLTDEELSVYQYLIMCEIEHRKGNKKYSDLLENARGNIQEKRLKMGYNDVTQYNA